MITEVLAAVYCVSTTWIGTFVIRHLSGRSYPICAAAAAAVQALSTIYAWYLLPGAMQEITRLGAAYNVTRMLALMTGLPATICAWLLLHFLLRLDASSLLFGKVWLWQMSGLGMLGAFLVGMFVFTFFSR